MDKNGTSGTGDPRAGTRDLISELHAYRQTPAYAKYLGQCATIQQQFALDDQDLAGGDGGIFRWGAEDGTGFAEVHRNVRGQFVLVSRRALHGAPFYDDASARVVTQSELIGWLYQNFISDVLPEALAELCRPAPKVA
jgi:hypothetical protein